MKPIVLIKFDILGNEPEQNYNHDHHGLFFAGYPAECYKSRRKLRRHSNFSTSLALSC